MRDQLLSSGVPVMIAGVCFIVLAYLARVRRERFLIYWTAAWALLVVRLGWTVMWGTPWPVLWPPPRCPPPTSSTWAWKAQPTS